MQKLLRLFIRYLGAGFFATLVHLVVFVCMLPYYGPTPSAFYAAVAGALVAYCLSRHWVFGQRDCNRGRFFITATRQVLSSTLIVTLLIHWGAPAQLSQLMTMVAVTLQGFTINYLWVFKHDSKREPLQ